MHNRADNIVLQHRVDGGSIQFILERLVVVGAFVGQRPTGTFAIAFVPPSVEYGEIQYTVHLSFLARGAGGFVRGWGVEPYVHTRYQTFGQPHVIVLQEDDLTQEFGTTGDLDNLLDQSPSATVGGCALPAKMNCTDVLGCSRCVPAFQVGEEQVRTFVGGKTTGEAYQQGVWIYLLQHVHDARWVGLVLEPSLLELHLDIVDQFLSGACADPRALHRYIPYLLPYLGIDWSAKNESPKCFS